MSRNLFVLSLVFLIAFALGYLLHADDTDTLTADSGAVTTGGAQFVYYTCPMHAHINEKHAGSCPICGMSLVEKRLSAAQAADAQDTIHVDAAVINNFSVKTTVVTRGTLYRELLTYGYVNKIDSSDSRPVSAPVSGRVVYLTGLQPGDEVAEGEVLARLESDSWRQLQQDYLDALDRKDPRQLRLISQQLKQSGFGLAQIQQLKNSGKPQSSMVIKAEQRGIIRAIDTARDSEVARGEVLLSLAPVFPIIGYAEVFEGQWRWLQPGQKASMVIRSVPNIVWQGEVLEVDDMLMNRSRTLKTRLGFREVPDVLLKPGMQANFTIYAAPRHEVLYVPQDAVIRTGAESRVILALPGGRFKAVPVRIGMEDGERIQILEGGPGDSLLEGMRVVSSAQFLLDSESQLKAEMRRMKMLVPQRENAAGDTGEQP